MSTSENTRNGSLLPSDRTTLSPQFPLLHVYFSLEQLGSLGSHLAAHFAALPNVETVICLNRHSSIDPALRQRHALEVRGISLETKALSRLRAFATDTAK